MPQERLRVKAPRHLTTSRLHSSQRLQKDDGAKGSTADGLGRTGPRWQTARSTRPLRTKAKRELRAQPKARTRTETPPRAVPPRSGRSNERADRDARTGATARDGEPPPFGCAQAQRFHATAWLQLRCSDFARRGRGAFPPPLWGREGALKRKAAAVTRTAQRRTSSSAQMSAPQLQQAEERRGSWTRVNARWRLSIAKSLCRSDAEGRSHAQRPMW